MTAFGFDLIPLKEMEGILVRVHLKHFMVFEDFTFRPGRNVNIVIAPNGCGKSCLVAGIMLGLCAQPRNTGRACEVGEFVKHGLSEANIEIELYNPSGNYIINRHIFREGNKSTWRINNVKVLQKQVEDLMSRFNIQVNNLCHVLPQDIVYEFCKMNPRTLLENTEKSFGLEILLEYHIQLKELCKLKQAIENKLKDKRINLEQEKAINRGLENPIEMIAMKAKSLEKLEVFKQQLAWCKYNEQYIYVNQVRKQRDKAKENLQNDEKRREEIIAKLDRLKQNVNGSLMEFECKKETKQKVQSQVAELHLEAQRSRKGMRLIETKYEEQKQTEIMRIKDLMQLKQQLSKLECDLAQYNRISEEEMTKKINKVETDLKLFTEKHRDLRHQEEELFGTLQNMGHHLSAEEEKIKRCEDKANQRLTVMQRMLPQVYQAVEWLRRNANVFKGKIFEPIMLEIEMKRESYAKFVEEVIPRRDLQAFVCEDIDDMNKFILIMRNEFNLSVNVVHSGPEHEPSSSFSANPTIDELRSFGFSMYIKDMFNAPETIMKYLCRAVRVHSIPVGSDLVDETYESIPSSVNLFFSDSNKYIVRSSKYTNEKIFSCNAIKNPTFLSAGIDQSVLAGLKKSVEKLYEKKQYLDDKLSGLKEQREECETEINRVRDERRQLKTSISEKELIERRITNKRELIAKTEAQNVDLEEEQLKTNQEKNGIVIKLCEVDQRIRMTVERLRVCVKESVETKWKVLKNKALLKKAKQDDRSAMRQIADRADEVKKLEDKYKELVIEAKQLHAEALKISGGKVPNNSFFSTITDDSDTLSRKIQELQAKLDFMKDADETLISEFEKGMQTISDLEAEIEKLTEEAEGVGGKLLKTREKWLPQLKSFIEKINTNFARYFAELGCAGEVLLDFDDPNDYEKYGIVIKVKFRDSDELQDLNQYTQSCGERSVATALYMIALQELSHVPFRCVDEINQGMDPVFERRVFNLLVNLTKRDDAPQYFILTPKLLPGLKYSPLMTVTCLMNGNFKKTDCWDIGKQIQMRKRYREQQEAGTSQTVSVKREINDD